MPGPGMGHRDLEKNIAIAIRGLNNILKHLKMIPGKPKIPEKTIYIGPEYPEPSTSPLVTKIGGFVVCEVIPGEIVEKGQKLANILDIWGNEVDNIYSPYKGLVRRIQRYPVVKPDSSPISVCKFLTKEEI
jgi:predicted deacylase